MRRRRLRRSIGLPRRIVDILEGESLLNDATGLLALEIGIAIMVRGQMPTVGGGLARLAYLIVGGLVIGLLIGVVVGWLEKFIDDGPVELVVSLVVPMRLTWRVRGRMLRACWRWWLAGFI